MEMAKGAFKTQLEVLEKVHPDQFEEYRKLDVNELAADAVFQQAKMASLQPKTGNAFFDMLNGNGIPIGSSIRGLEDAIRTHRDMETQDPSEQIAKAVLEKFQTQILPGLVANMIAGKNPFKMPQQARGQPGMALQRAMVEANRAPKFATTNELEMPEVRRTQVSDDWERRELGQRLKSSPRLRALLQNAEVASLLTPRMKDAPLRRLSSVWENDDMSIREMEARAKLDGKSQIVLGIHDIFNEDDEENVETNEIRRSPLNISPSLAEALSANSEVKNALEKMKYRVNDVESLLEPKKMDFNKNPQPGFTVPRKLPQRPRKMIPLLIGMDSKEAEEIRRNPTAEWKAESESRVVQALKNNPSTAALFMDEKLEKILSGRRLLTDEQRGKPMGKKVKVFPRLFGTKTLQPIDGKVSQIIEERPVPPLNWTPKGRHTRLRWTGANEKEIPGIGSRVILPSLDPTMPAVSSGFSTQGRARDEWDTIFKIPNGWAAGDEVGFDVKSSSKRFVGGNGGFDMPALNH